MKYIIIIVLALSLPATALVSTVSKNNPSEIKTTVATNKSKQETEQRRKSIQRKIGNEICDPKKELELPTFY